MDRTTNYNLKKPSTGDPVLVGDLNDNMDVIDTQLNAITDGIAIIANGNTHAAIAKNQAVFVKNHSSLANGLYWATAAISANGALSTSNLTADTSGGLNKLHDDITTLNSNTLKSQTEALGNITTEAQLNALTSGLHNRYLSLSGITPGWYGILVATADNIDAIPTQILFGTSAIYVRHSDDKVNWVTSRYAHS